MSAVEPGFGPNAKPADPALIRCYALADGRLAHELKTDFPSADPDRVDGNFLLAVGYDSKWETRGRTSTYTPRPPYAHDLWELPTRGKVRVFEADARAPAALGPGGRYVVRAAGDRAVEVVEPFVLRRAVLTVSAPDRAERFEFTADGRRAAVAFADASVAVWDAAAWRARVDERVAKEVPADLGPLWDDLAKDPAAGLRAARLLSAAGDRGVAFLRGKAGVRPGPDPAAVGRLIADLDAAGFAARERAEKGLAALAGSAEPHLRRALAAGPPAETRRRVEALLRPLDAGTLTAGEVRDVRAVQALRWADTPAARALLAAWAAGDPGAALTKAAGGS